MVTPVFVPSNALYLSYNTTAHHTTGLAPHYVMFGCEPQLTVDFLIGTDKEDPGEETPEESLRVVHDHVQQQPDAKAEPSGTKSITNRRLIRAWKKGS